MSHRRTTRRQACFELSKVIGYNEDAKPIGLPYDEVLANLREWRMDALGQTPEQAARLNMKSLKWYVKEIRAGNDEYAPYATLPYMRPRSDWKKYGMNTDGVLSCARITRGHLIAREPTPVVAVLKPTGRTTINGARKCL